MKLLVLIGVLVVWVQIVLEVEGHFWGRRRRRRRRTVPPPEPDCYVSAWSSWSACSIKCNTGTQSRTRYLLGGPTTFCRRPALRQQRVCGEQNGGCGHLCNAVSGACSCHSGYSLLSDGKRCQDINECQTNGGRGPCSHTCQNTAGSYKCDCPTGYILGTDRKTCQAKDCRAPFLSHCHVPVYTDHVGMVCQKVTANCPLGTRLNAQCHFNCPTDFGIAKINDFSLPFAKVVRNEDFQNVVTSTTCGLDTSGRAVWSNASAFPTHYFCRRRNDPPSNILLSKTTLREHSSVGTVVGSLSVTVPIQTNGITYSMQPSAGQYFFQIQGNRLLNTWVPRWKNLQGLQINNYHIIIRATSPGLPQMWLDKNFTITVTNVNDPPYSIRISNNSVMDTATHGHVIGVLSAIDYDGPRGNLPSSDFVWSLIDDDRGRFGLQGPNLVVAGALNHQAHQYHRIIVNCTDKDRTNPRWAQATIVINIINTNDSPKNVRFKAHKLYENASIGFVAGEFTAYDEDGDKLTFSVSQSDADTLRTFELGPTICFNSTVNSVRHSLCRTNLILKDTVDYETKNTYSVKLTVADPSGAFNLKEFLVHVVNLNEAPTGITISKNYVLENSPAGTVVGQLAIADPDTSQRSPQGHTCVVSPSSPFLIQGLNLVVSGDLDYESKASYQINVTCTDNGVPPLSIWKTFIITVRDQNEGPEYLTLSWSSIPENARIGSVVGQLMSRDPDVNSGRLTYHIKSPVNSPFGISGQANSSLVTTRRLDFETQSEFDLLISVTDNGGLSLEKYFKIKVTDVNEAPTDIIVVPLILPENSPPGTWIGSITVVDEDFNSTASCRIVSRNTDYFAVSAMHLVAGTKKTDYEALGSMKSLDVKLRCTDAYGLSVEKVFHVQVTDVNEPPTDIKVTVRAVSENQINAVVGQIAIQDPDVGQGHMCSVVNNGTTGTLFEVEKATLQIKTRRPLNFEGWRQYSLTVSCSDVVASGQSQFTIFKDIVVNVTDINERPNNPCPQQIYVDEAASNGSVVWTFKPRDPDNEEYETGISQNQTSLQPKQNLIVGISSGAPALPFVIADEQYLVKTGKLDRLKQSTYNVLLNVTDDGMLVRLRNGKYERYQGHRLNVTFNCKVEVLSSGDQRLQLDIALSSNTISEDALNGTRIGTLSVINGKRGSTYQLRVMQAESAPFRIVRSDLILVTGAPLDYETTNSTGVGIIAVGSDGTTVQRLFLIRIINVNERPVKMCILGKKTVDELTNADQIVGQIFIEDPDHIESRGICSRPSPSLRQSQNFSCQIESNFIDVSELARIFYIDQNLRLHGNTTFDYRAKKQYSLPIICRDIHKPVHLIEKTTVINVLESSTKPRWDFALSSASVAENAANGTEIGALSIINGGSDSYSFKVTDDRKPFRVFGTKLVLYTSAPLDYETSNSTNIIIESKNSKGLAVSKSFTILITNVNERPVNMCLANALSVIPEKSPTDSVIGQIIVEDPDHPESKGLCRNGAKVIPEDHTYSCEIFSNTVNVNDIKSKFYIDQQFRLHRKSDFVYKSQSIYNIPVMCRDKKKPIFLIERTFVFRIEAPSCPTLYKLVNGICVCENGMSGPKCDRDPYICAKTKCAKTEVCVSHISATKRCIPRLSQVPILLQLPFTIASQVQNKYKIESYVESIFEGRRPAGQTLNSLFSKNVISRRKRDIPKDVYVEAASSQRVLSFHSYVIFVAMDPNSGYTALSGSSMCALLNGTDIRCVNEEDCKLLIQAGIECPYVFPDIGKSGTGKRKAEDGQGSSPKPWVIGVGSVTVICVVAFLLICFVIRRKRSKRKSDQPMVFQELEGRDMFGLANPVYSGETVSPENSPQVIPSRRGLQPLVNNNLNNQQSSKKPANIKRFDNPLYKDKQRLGNLDLNNPLYDTSSNLQPPGQTNEHLYESVGKKLGKEAVNVLVEEEKMKAKEKGLDEGVVALPEPKYDSLKENGNASYEKPDNRKVVLNPKGKSNNSTC